MLVSPTNPLGFLHQCFLLFGLKNILIDHVSENILFLSSDGNSTYNTYSCRYCMNKIEPKTKGPYG